MDYEPVLAFVGKVVIAGGGLGYIVYNVFKFLGAKWLDARFAERLQHLKAEEDRSVRHIQSTIDREIHRAKKLYDSEFTALSGCWRLLREAYDQSVGTIASFTANVERLTGEELERFFTKIGMEEWNRNELRQKTARSAKTPSISGQNGSDTRRSTVFGEASAATLTRTAFSLLKASSRSFVRSNNWSSRRTWSMSTGFGTTGLVTEALTRSTRQTS